MCFRVGIDNFWDCDEEQLRRMTPIYLWNQVDSGVIYWQRVDLVSTSIGVLVVVYNKHLSLDDNSEGPVRQLNV